jgi:hypothetical protein
MCAFYKLANKDTFAYGGFIYPSYPANEDEMKKADMSLTAQLDELNEIGFDGIKMLEGKPNLYARVGKALDSDFFDEAFAKMEREGTYLLMHAVDPSSFWENGTEEAIAKGWFYGDESKYPSYNEIYRQVESFLEKHPSLNLCLAHFFFCSENPEKIENMLEKYKNLTFDITPGGEQYFRMLNEWEYWHDFILRYQDKIFYGTDFYAFSDENEENWKTAFWRRPRFVRQFFETDTEHDYLGRKFRGIKLDEKILQKLYWDNAMGWFGEPKKIDVAYMQKKAETLLQKPNKRAKFANHDLAYILKEIEK